MKDKLVSSLVARISFMCHLLTFMHHTWLYQTICNQSRYLPKNPGQKPNSSPSFSICYRNLNIISTQNFLKLFLLQACVTVSLMQLGGIKIFQSQKIRQEQLTKFTNILNYIKTSCIVFCIKMSRYSHCIYISYKKNHHIFIEGNSSKRVLVWKYRDILSPKNYRRKIGKTHKFSIIIFSAKISSYSKIIYCVQEE